MDAAEIRTRKDIPQKKRSRISEFIVDETIFKEGDEFIFLWVAIELLDKVILGIRISLERSILIAEHFLRSLVRKYGKYPVSTDGGTWYSQVCKFLKIKHHLHTSY
jgi:putative transposase